MTDAPQRTTVPTAAGSRYGNHYCKPGAAAASGTRVFDRSSTNRPPCRLASGVLQTAPISTLLDSPATFTRRAILLLYICLDHLRRGSGRQVAVLAFLQQGAHHDLRIASRLDSSKPSVIFEVRFAAAPIFALSALLMVCALPVFPANQFPADATALPSRPDSPLQPWHR